MKTNNIKSSCRWQKDISTTRWNVTISVPHCWLCLGNGRISEWSEGGSRSLFHFSWGALNLRKREKKKGNKKVLNKLNEEKWYLNFNATGSYERIVSHLCWSHCTNSIEGPSLNALKIQQKKGSIPSVSVELSSVWPQLMCNQVQKRPWLSYQIHQHCIFTHTGQIQLYTSLMHL